MISCFQNRVTELALIALWSSAWFVAMMGFASAAENTDTGRLIGIDQVPYIFDIMFDPAEPDSILLATREGLYRAWNDGTAERISQRRKRIWSLSIGPGSPTRLYALGIADDGRAGNFLVSNDRGRNWRGLTSPSLKNSYLRIIEASKTTSGSLYGVGHEFWGSSDSGLNWESMGVPPSRIIDLAASAVDAQRIFAATFSGLLVSGDGGHSWRPTGGRPKCRQPVMAVDTGTDGAVYAYSLCAGLIRGDEATDTWTVVNDRFGGCIIQHLAVDPQNSAQVYAVLGCRKVLVSDDMGLTWRALGSQRMWEPDCATNSTGYPEPNNG